MHKTRVYRDDRRLEVKRGNCHLRVPLRLDATRRAAEIGILSTHLLESCQHTSLSPPLPNPTMPSLSDTLAHLHAQSHQIVSLSNANYKPPGPFVDAVLRSHDVLSLIRDADPSEARLFKFVGEETSGNKRVEKRDGGVVTPLKQLKNGTATGMASEGKDNVRAILQTAMTLVDD